MPEQIDCLPTPGFHNIDVTTRGSSIIPLLERLEAAKRGGDRLAELSDTLNEKAGKIDAWEQAEVKTFLHLTNSPTVTFGVKVLPPPSVSAEFGTLLYHEWWQKLQVILEALAARRLTGNAAAVAIAEFLARCNDIEKKWTERAIKQDLRLNMGAKEINKAVPKPFIPVFEVPLATDIKKVKLDKILALSHTWALQPKLDGARCVAFCRADGSVDLLSRTGKTWKNFESVRKTLLTWNGARLTALKTQDLIAPDVVFDGEVVSLRPDGSIDFQGIQKTMMRDDGVEVGTLQYVVFDACGQNQWFNPTLPYGHRLEIATQFIMAPPTDAQPAVRAYGKNVTVIPSEVYVDDAVKLHAKEIHDKYVLEGYEGLMIRADRLPVENKRSKILLKMKEFEDSEAVITGAVEGNGKYAGMLGALQCKLGADPRGGPAFEIGSGFSDAQRAELWARRDSLPGQLANFKFFELTDDGIPRFPIFRSLRSQDDCAAPATEKEE